MTEAIQRSIDAYAEPAVYDILHTPGTAAEVDLLEALADRFASPSSRRRRWLEPACGTGRYLRVLTGRGHRGVGFDRDPGMLDYARTRQKNPGARWVQADMSSFVTAVGAGRFEVGFILVNSFRHLLEARAVRRHFREMAAALVPGGIYIVGISLSDYEGEEASEDVWTATRGRCSVRQIVQYLPPDRQRRRETVFSHMQIDRPSGREHLDSNYELRSYDRRQWSAAWRGTGFERAGAVDDRGRDIGSGDFTYQLEILRRV